MPSFPGILMSRSTASGRRASISASPERASCAEAVSKPSYSRIILIAWRTEASSSTMSTRIGRSIPGARLLADFDDREERERSLAEPPHVEAQVIALLRVANDSGELLGRAEFSPVDLGNHVAFGESRVI